MKFKKVLAGVLLTITLFAIALNTAAQALGCLSGQGPLQAGQVYCPVILGYQLNCDPAFPPNEGGCGFPEFIGLANHFITWLTGIIITLAVIMIIAGGFVILTAGGSKEKFKTGKKIIFTALTGVLIALGSWLIIRTIYTVLVAERFQNIF